MWNLFHSLLFLFLLMFKLQDHNDFIRAVKPSSHRSHISAAFEPDSDTEFEERLWRKHFSLHVDFEIRWHKGLISTRQSYMIYGSEHSSSQCSQFASTQKALWVRVLWINDCNRPKYHSWDSQITYTYISLSAHCEVGCSPWFPMYLQN